MVLAKHLQSLGLVEAEWDEAKKRHAMRDAHLRAQLTQVLSLISAELDCAELTTGGLHG